MEQMVIQTVRTEGVVVPCHVEKELQLIRSDLWIVHIHNPLLTRMMTVSLTHLFIDQAWLCGRQPKVIMRTSPIAEMIIYTCPTTSLLLSLIRKTRHITIVVITPDEHHIIGYLQTIFKDTEHLFIRHESLRDFRQIGIDIPAEHLALVINHPLQPLGMFIECLRTNHIPVMQTAHADGIYILTLSHQLYAFQPIVAHSLSVSQIVILPDIQWFPFCGRIAHHRFAMAGAHNDTTGISHLLGSRHMIEGNTHLMHGRPYHITPQTKQQLEDFLVSLRTDPPLFGKGFLRDLSRFKSLGTPYRCTPVFIVDENTTAFHRRNMQGGKVLIEDQPVAMHRNLVSPPYPRRDTGLSG